MVKFRDLIGRPGEETTTTLEAAVARAEQVAAETVARMGELGKQRRAALIADDEKALDRIERDLALATRDRDRAVEAGLALGERLAEAKRRDEQAKIEALHGQAMRARDAAAAVLRTRYAKAAREIVAAATELQQLDAEREALNLRLRQEGAADRLVEGPDELVRPARGPTRLIATPVYTGLAVPHPEDGGRLAWPPGKDIFGGVALPERDAA